MSITYLPKISVLMSCFNSAEFLDEAIISILMQDYTNFEFIIIDDGSTDNTLKIITEYSKNDSRIKVVSQQNMGLTKSLNKAIDLATGEFIARMDADDISLAFRFSKFIKYINCFPNIQFYSTPAILLNESDNSESLIPNCIRRIFFDSRMLNYYCSLIHGTLIMKTDIIKKLKYNESYVCAQDFELYHRAISLGYKISYDADNTSYKLRSHDSNITKTKSSTQMDAFKSVLKFRNKKFYRPNLLNRILFLLNDVILFLKFKLKAN